MLNVVLDRTHVKGSALLLKGQYNKIEITLDFLLGKRDPLVT